MHPLTDVILENLRIDISQMAEEGHDEQDLLEELERARKTGTADALLDLQEDLWRRPSPPDFPYEEPNDWESISRTFPDPESHDRFGGTDAALADRLLAAWQGRCVGCQLGKPLEGTMWPDTIRQVLEVVGSWPLEDYMNPLPEGVDRETLPECAFFKKPAKNAHTKGRFHAVSPDDDIHYALINQKVLETYGPAFTTEQAIATLIAHTPGSMIFAAGRNMWRTALFGLKPPYTAQFGNPCRQSLGAQIRCDPWGWGAPANPALAARMAYTDAVGSQRRNGIYSGIFFAVALSDTLAHGDPVRAIDTAFAYVPPRSRFAEMVEFVTATCRQQPDWQKVNAAILERYRREAERFNHSIPNAAIVLLGLIKGDGDFTRTLGITVMSGLDTDCTGATAGSIMGCALGTKGIPAHWTEPFNDTIRTELAGMQTVRISETARRMVELARQNARWAGTR